MGQSDGARKRKQSSAANPVTIKQQPEVKKPKLSYNERRELGNLPARIEKLEQQQSELEEQMSQPGFYQSDYEQVQEATEKLAEVQRQLELAFARWGELEGGS
jgi:ATP-binding cassette subfamily F protein uup